MIYIFISADSGKLPKFIITLYNFPFGDKVGHFLLIGSFTFIVQFCFISNTKILSQNRNILLRVALIVGLVITIEEFTQLFFLRRTFSILDLFCSYLGIAVFSLVNLKYLTHQHKKNQHKH
jgi:uncharacterized membrane protein YczE